MRAERDAWVSQIRKGVVELAVLGLLARDAKYGGQIVDELAEEPALTITTGTVYPLLARLRKAGLVETAWHESPVGPPRKYYELTPHGRETVAEMTGAWRSVATALDRTLPTPAPDAGGMP